MALGPSGLCGVAAAQDFVVGTRKSAQDPVPIPHPLGVDENVLRLILKRKTAQVSATHNNNI